MKSLLNRVLVENLWFIALNRSSELLRGNFIQVSVWSCLTREPVISQMTFFLLTSNDKLLFLPLESQKSSHLTIVLVISSSNITFLFALVCMILGQTSPGLSVWFLFSSFLVNLRTDWHKTGMNMKCLG